MGICPTPKPIYDYLSHSRERAGKCACDTRRSAVERRDLGTELTLSDQRALCIYCTFSHPLFNHFLNAEKQTPANIERGAMVFWSCGGSWTSS